MKNHHKMIMIINQHQAFDTQLLKQLSGSYLASFFEKFWISEFPNSDDTGHTGHQTKPFLSDDSDDIPVFVEDWQANYP